MRPIRCGDLYWLDQDDGRAINPPYSHPHVVTAVLGTDSAGAASVEACTLTTNLAAAAEPGNILLDKGEGGLPRQSVIVVSRVSTLPAERLRVLIGSLSEERVQQIRAGIQFLDRSFTPAGERERRPRDPCARDQ
jgi:mRNA interferase MazF